MNHEEGDSLNRRKFHPFPQPHGALFCRLRTSSPWPHPGNSSRPRRKPKASARRSAPTTRSPRLRRLVRNHRSRARRWASASSTWSRSPVSTVKTIYGGEGTNKYLLETTGCGLAFYDYDDDGWLDLFLVNGWRLEGLSPPGRSLTAISSKTIAMAPSPMSPRAPASSTRPDGDRLAASATTTTMAMMISSSLTTARTFFTATTATGHLPM